VLQSELDCELEAVARCFARELRSDLPCVNELTVYLEKYRGKMLRPTLLLLSAKAASPHRAIAHDQRTLAAVVEMVHMATLVHDDVLDDQDVRRRAATVNRLRGNEAAVMLGDYLISHAYHLCSGLGSTALSRLIAHATNTVCEGELLQLSNRTNWSLDEATYMEIIRRKTAALCGVSARLGAILVEAHEPVADALETYAERAGAAFQIIDDVLDLTGDPKIVGKSLGKDLEKGKLTLPIIRHLSASTDAERKATLALLARGGEEAAHQIVTRLTSGDGIDYARSRAAAIVREANQSLAALPESPARELLTHMAEAILTRRL